MPHIDFHSTVINALSNMTRTSGAIEQTTLRRLFSLTPAYLILDTTINNEDAGLLDLTVLWTFFLPCIRKSSWKPNRQEQSMQ